MIDDMITLGRNIQIARKAKGMTQRQLSEEAQISQTQLSDYENDNKMPSLFTLAKIAHCLEKSLDELYFGDATISFITASPDKGSVIVNCLVALWKQGIINVYESRDDSGFESNTLMLSDHISEIKRLMNSLYEFESKRYTYSDPKGYLKYMKQSIINEINQEEEIREIKNSI